MENFAVKSNNKELLRAFEEKLIGCGYKNHTYDTRNDKYFIIIYNTMVYSFSNHAGLYSEIVFNLPTDWLEAINYLNNIYDMKRNDEILNLKRQVEKLNDRISQLEQSEKEKIENQNNNNIIKVPDNIKIYKYDEDILGLGISNNRVLYVKDGKWLICDAEDLMKYKCKLKEIRYNDIKVGDIIIDFNIDTTEYQFSRHYRYNIMIDKNKFMYETDENKIVNIVLSNHSNIKFYKVIPI